MSLSVILGTIGVLITLKSLWVLIAPASVRKLTSALVQEDRTLRTMGAVMLLVGIVLIGVAWVLR